MVCIMETIKCLVYLKAMILTLEFSGYGGPVDLHDLCSASEELRVCSPNLSLLSPEFSRWAGEAPHHWGVIGVWGLIQCNKILSHQYRKSHCGDCLISTMAIPMLVRPHLYFGTVPWGPVVIEAQNVSTVQYVITWSIILICQKTSDSSPVKEVMGCFLWVQYFASHEAELYAIWNYIGPCCNGTRPYLFRFYLSTKLVTNYYLIQWWHNLCCHMTSLGLNGFISWKIFEWLGPV